MNATERDVEYHGLGHGEEGRDPAKHRLLGLLHTDTTPGNPVRGDVIVAMTSTPKWGRYALIVPAANVRNVLGVDNTEVEPTWKTALDSTAPTTIAEGDAAAAGTSLIFAHRDHKHGAPATWKATAHNLLDGDRHGDTVTQTVSRGSIVYGNSTPKWDELALGSAGQRLSSVSSDLAWITPATYSANGGSLAATTNTTGLMGGLGGTATITPTFSGRVLISIYGHGINGTGSDGFAVGIRTGTGTAPAAGDALTGTARGNVQNGVSASSNITVPFNVTVLVTGLTVGTAYWIDLSKASLAGGSATILATYISAVEQ